MKSFVMEATHWDRIVHMGDDELQHFSPADSPLFREIRDVLVKHDKHRAFGLFLIHKHFKVGAHEEMIEAVDFKNRTIIVSPIARNELDVNEIIPTNWIFPAAKQSHRRVALTIQTLQYGLRADLAMATAIDPFAEVNIECLGEVRQVLARYGAQNRFGMFLIRNQFEPTETEDFLECTDQPTRTLTIAPVGRGTIGSDSVPTNWVFTPTEEVAAACCKCATRADGHQRRHEQY